MMIRAAITGNIGSGKSMVTRIFRVLGVPVFVADVEAKKLYELPEVKQEVKDLFGSRVFDAQGDVNREALARIIFNDKASLQKINEIIHPRTLDAYQKWLTQYEDLPYTLHESAILFENKLQHHFDRIINVYAPFELRLKRVTQRDHVDESFVIDRMRNQMGDEEKNKLADYIIRNDERSFLIPQVMAIHKQINES